jgi:transposase-like protein
MVLLEPCPKERIWKNMNEYAELELGQERAIIALLSEPTLRAAAASAGISETTLWRWLREPIFKDAYRKARSDALAQATAKLQALAAEAVETLVEIHRNREISAHIRVSAARAVLDLAYKVHEIEDLEARIEALEEAAV